MSKIPGGNSGIRPPQDEPKTDNNISGGGAGQQAAPTSTNVEGQKRVMSAADVERLASQAGFSRTGGKKNKKGIDLGDSSQAPIPLPEDDLDGTDPANAMNYEGLDEAQSQMLHHGAAMTRSRSKGARSLMGMWQALIAGEGTQDEDEDADDAREARSKHLQSLGSEVPPDAEAMAGLTASIREQFGIDLAGTPIGPQMMAASLLVAGQQEDVALAATAAEGAPKSLDAERLFQGASRVIDAGRQAADDARSRAGGMQRNLSIQRTFVPKR